MRKYPLDPLLRVRDERVDQRTRTARRRAKSPRSRRLRDRAPRARKAAAGKSETRRCRHRARVARRGELTVQRPGARCRLAGGAELKRAVMSRAVDDARADQVRAGDVAERERAALLASQADAQVVAEESGSLAKGSRRREVSRRKKKTPKKRIWQVKREKVAMRLSVGCLVSAAAIGFVVSAGCMSKNVRVDTPTPRSRRRGNRLPRAEPARVEQRERSARRGRRSVSTRGW